MFTSFNTYGWKYPKGTDLKYSVSRSSQICKNDQVTRIPFFLEFLTGKNENTKF